MQKAERKNKKGRTEVETRQSVLYKYLDYSPAEIASVGHSSAQVPQSRHASASITNLPSPSEIASAGHAAAQVPQLTQSSEITYAIMISSFKLVYTCIQAICLF